MTTYRFKAITGAGAVERGFLDAPSERAALQALRSQGKYPVFAKLKTTSFVNPALLRDWRRKLGRQRRLATATQELASLMAAGVELDAALGLLSDVGDVGELRGVFADLRARVREGAALADAMEEHAVFSRFYVGLVRSGEMGGDLEAAVSRLSDYLLRSSEIRETVTSALIYPVILLFSALISVSIILFFVLPEFEPLFADSQHEMPMPARIALAISAAARGYWWLALILLFAGALWVHRAMKSETFQTRFHGRLLRVPIVGPLLTAMESERLMRNVGASLQSGVALPVALTLAKDALWNLPMRRVIGDTATSLREGESLSGRLARAAIFPAHMLDMIRIGEETGRLGEMLVRQADFEAQRNRRAIDRLLSLLVPVMTVGLGLLVGGLIASMLTAIFSFNDLALQ